MFDKFSKLAQEFIKVNTDMALNNGDKIFDLALTGLEMATNAHKEIINSQNILEAAPKIIRDNTINFVHEALNKVSPLPIKIDKFLTDKMVVISEENLNTYLKKQLKKSKELENINIEIKDNNILFIEGQASKYFIKVSFSQKLKLDNFVMNKENAFIEFEIVDKFDLKAQNIIVQFLIFLATLLFKSVISENFIKIMEDNNIKLIDNKLILDLKKNALKDFYKNDLNEIMNKIIPVMGNLTLLDLMSIRDIKTKEDNILIYLKIL